MVAIFLASSASSDWLGLMLALCVVGSLGGFMGTKSRRLLCWLLVAAVLAYGASVAYAVPFNCPPLWRYLGIC